MNFMEGKKGTMEKWRGYTIDEIQYQKAITLLRLEMQKERIQAMKDGMFTSVSQNRLGKTFSAVYSYKNLFAYFFAGYKLYAALRRLRDKFRRKR